MRIPIILNWSGGTEGALAWDRLAASGEYEVVALLTTLTQGDERIGMHGVRRELLQAQSSALRVPLEEVFIPPRADQDIYEAALGTRLENYRRQGVQAVAFGDWVSTDHRRHREDLLARWQMQAVFPLRYESTSQSAETFLDRGWRAVVCCCDGRLLDVQQVGKWYDRSFLAGLPKEIDPCGEQGEFHTFLFDGPGFTAPILFRRGGITQFGPFWYCDLSLVSPMSLCA